VSEHSWEQAVSDFVCFFFFFFKLVIRLLDLLRVSKAVQIMLFCLSHLPVALLLEKLNHYKVEVRKCDGQNILLTTFHVTGYNGTEILSLADWRPASK
jgi:hypothetical protein